MRKKIQMIPMKRTLKRLGRLAPRLDQSSDEKSGGEPIEEPDRLDHGIHTSVGVKLTEEQKHIVRHPDGRHARVLAVAGSGKTSAMAHRIQYLMSERGVKGNQIQALMFNRMAREQFRERLEELEIGRPMQPHVDTFHSFAFRVSSIRGHKPWFGEHEWMKMLKLRMVLSTVEKQHNLREYDLSLSEAERAISLWKGALTLPSCAGYSGPEARAYIDTFRKFEEIRHKENAITYDDFIPLAVTLLEGDRHKLEVHAGPLRYIIVDEYQDVNMGQQRLIEVLASRGADVMVVGDDDQTIYEWRGARSEYILREFMITFDNKPHHTYNLSRSFRFGYGISQAAYNVISHNTNRTEKNLLAHFPDKDCDISMFTSAGSANDSERGMTEQLSNLLDRNDVKPSDIRVLGRTYAQLNSLSTEFILGKIPFILEDSVPFFKTTEAKVLLDYLRIAAVVNKVPNSSTDAQFLNIANKPSRYLGRADLERMLRQGRNEKSCLGELLFETAQDPTRFNRGSQKQKFEELMSVLEETNRKIHHDPTPSAGQLLGWLEKKVGLIDHYQSYYGTGEVSLVQARNILALINYAKYTELDWRGFIKHIDNFDTSLGRPANECIVMTTIHKTKGLEFDYVFMPDCREGLMPVFAQSQDLTFDKRDPGRKPMPAEWIENERRLFYVGITRACKKLFEKGQLGASRRTMRRIIAIWIKATLLSGSRS